MFPILNFTKFHYIYVCIIIHLIYVTEIAALGYVNCYDDSGSYRLLNVNKGRDVGNIQDCATKCVGYTYFGMEVNSEALYRSKNCIVYGKPSGSKLKYIYDNPLSSCIQGRPADKHQNQQTNLTRYKIPIIRRCLFQARYLQF